LPTHPASSMASWQHSNRVAFVFELQAEIGVTFTPLAQVMGFISPSWR
jgi:hypothetical protein